MKLSSDSNVSARALPTARATVSAAPGSGQGPTSFHFPRQSNRRQGLDRISPALRISPTARTLSGKPLVVTSKAARHALRAAEMAVWEQADARSVRQELRRSATRAVRTSAGESFYFGLFVMVSSVGIAFGLSDSFRAVLNWEKITAFIAQWIG